MFPLEPRKSKVESTSKVEAHVAVGTPGASSRLGRHRFSCNCPGTARNACCDRVCRPSDCTGRFHHLMRRLPQCRCQGQRPIGEEVPAEIPPDLTRIRKRANGVFDEQAVYDWILGLKMTGSHGSREMPIWGDWLMDEAVEDSTSLDAAKAAEREVEARIKAIVKYLRTLQVE